MDEKSTWKLGVFEALKSKKGTVVSAGLAVIMFTPDPVTKICAASVVGVYVIAQAIIDWASAKETKKPEEKSES